MQALPENKGGGSVTFLDIALIVLGAYAVMIVGWVILTRIATPDQENK